MINNSPNSICKKSCGFNLKIIQGDSYRNIYRFYDNQCNLIDNEYLQDVYFTCDRLNYTQKLSYDEENTGWVLFIPSNITATFPYLKTKYDLTLFFVYRQVLTAVYQAEIQVRKKEIIPIISDEEIISDYNYPCDIAIDVYTNVIFTNDSTNNYDLLNNKPSINGVILIGNKTSSDLDIIEDKHYIHTQYVADREWQVNHNLDKYPSVTIVDSGGNIVIGDIEYLTANSLIITFTVPFSGYAYLN